VEKFMTQKGKDLLFTIILIIATLIAIINIEEGCGEVKEPHPIYGSIYVH
jgi:hypothetical protein